MEDDRLDGRVVAELLQFTDNWLRGEDDTLQIDHANAIAETANAGFSTRSVEREIYQREDGKHEQEECSAADQNPEECARTSLGHGKSVALGNVRVGTEALVRPREGEAERVNKQTNREL